MIPRKIPVPILDDTALHLGPINPSPPVNFSPTDCATCPNVAADIVDEEQLPELVDDVATPASTLMEALPIKSVHDLPRLAPDGPSSELDKTEMPRALSLTSVSKDKEFMLVSEIIAPLTYSLYIDCKSCATKTSL